MNLPLILLIAVGLSMDAFAVAVAAGASIQKHRTIQALRIGGSFGFFQMLMPILGWILGSSLKRFIVDVDHWIAFGLLAAIGLKMIHEAFVTDEVARDKGPMSRKRLFLLSVATSIDALAVGVSFAFLDFPVLLSAAIIGLVTFVIATAGVFIGHVASSIWGKRAEFVGGATLILVGLKILLEHLKG